MSTHAHRVSPVGIPALPRSVAVFQTAAKRLDREEVKRGPYCAREAALRNAIAFLVRHMLHMGLTEGEAVRIYRAAGMPILPRWPGIETEGRADA